MARPLKLDDLIIWQLARELEGDVLGLVKRTRAQRDLKFAAQLTDAVSSVASNITEGFHRFNAREFVRFLRYARGSLAETEQRLRSGVRHGYFTQHDIEPMLRLTRRLGKALFRFHAYLAARTAAPKKKPHNRSG